MELKGIIALGVMALGLPIAGYAVNELIKRHIKSVKFSDLEKEINYIGKTVEFKGNEVKEIRVNYIGKTVEFKGNEVKEIRVNYNPFKAMIKPIKNLVKAGSLDK